MGSIPRSGRSPGRWYGNPFQYSCLGNPTDRGDWEATVHGVAKNQTQLKQWYTAHTQHTLWTLSLRHSYMIHSHSSDHTRSNSLNTVLSWLRDIKMETLSCSHHCCCCCCCEVASVVAHSLWPPWSITHQAPLSMGFPRQEYWSGLPFPPPGAFQVALVIKNPPANEGDIIDADSIPGLGKSPGGGHSNSLQYSCPEGHHRQRSLADYNL